MTYGQIRPAFMRTNNYGTRPAYVERVTPTQRNANARPVNRQAARNTGAARPNGSRGQAAPAYGAGQAQRSTQAARGVNPGYAGGTRGVRYDRDEYMRARREYERRTEYERRLREMKLYEKRVKAELKQEKQAEKAREKREKKKREREFIRSEIKVKRAKLPFSFVVMLAAATVMIMAVVFSFSQVSETTARLSEVQDRLVELDAEEERLNHDLAMKNDVSVIEKRATEELMMVRESSLDKKYISLASEDRVVLDNDGDGADEKNGGTLLSAFMAVFGNLMDYID